MYTPPRVFYVHTPFSCIDIREDLGKRHTRHMFANEAQRRHFVTRRDVLNMSRKVNHLSRIRHENDAQSVEEIVAELKQESYNPILCYKRQGILDPDIPQLPADGFVVVFQTKFQKDLYEMFASTIVCIDSTHKTNSHNFKLITVVVPDEYGEGILCCTLYAQEHTEISTHL